MRWIVGTIAALLVAWAVYVASPYWALRQIGGAVTAGDAAGLAERVNFRALRHSLIRQVAAELAATDRSGQVSARDSQLALSALASAAEPLVDELLAGRGLLDLFRRTASAGASVAAPFEGGAPSPDRLAAYLAVSSWRGFRNVYFALPLRADRDRRFRLQLRLGRLRWRLVGLEIPAEMRRGLARTLAERHGGRIP